jgi:hypothetical protein
MEAVEPTSFEGDFSTMWGLGWRPPLWHLTWDWWWWLVMLDDEEGRPAGQQLMVLWSTKDNDRVEVNGFPWLPKGRPSSDEHGALVLDGMVCAWWFDGERMHEPYIKRTCNMIAMTDSHPKWPGRGGKGEGGGAVVPLLPDDLSMGLRSDKSSFWLNLRGDKEAVAGGAPAAMALTLTPWNPAMSVARPSTATYAAGMGYDILRVHGTRVHGTVDDREVQGTAYFQKVCVQAPSPPWYWGVLHFEDGSYMDWFLPHLAPTLSARDARPWKKRDINHISLSQGGLFHDAKHQRTERFARVEVVKGASQHTEGPDGHSPEASLPMFTVHMYNGRTSIKLEVQAVERAHWHFDQPTRGGLWSHLTYNEYPLELKRLEIKDEFGLRTRKDYGWARGNAEHAWGMLH